MNTKQFTMLGIILAVVLITPSLFYWFSNIFYYITYATTGDDAFAGFITIALSLSLIVSGIMYFLFNLIEGNIPNPWEWFKQLK